MRELLIMAEACRHENWDHTAMLCAEWWRTQVKAKHRSAVKLEHFHPYLREKLKDNSTPFTPGILRERYKQYKRRKSRHAAKRKG